MAIGGFYRQWSKNGIKLNEAEKTKSIEEFANQLQEIAAKYQNIVILGDVNLCSKKWNNDTFLQKMWQTY